MRRFTGMFGISVQNRLAERFTVGESAQGSDSQHQGRAALGFDLAERDVVSPFFRPLSVLMPQIRLTRSHKLSPDILRERAETLVGKLAAKMEAMNMTYTWRPDKMGIDLKGQGFTGKLELGPGPDEVTVVVDLSFMLSPFKGMVEERIRKNLEKYLADEVVQSPPK